MNYSHPSISSCKSYPNHHEGKFIISHRFKRKSITFRETETKDNFIQMLRKKNFQWKEFQRLKRLLYSPASCWARKNYHKNGKKIVNITFEQKKEYTWCWKYTDDSSSSILGSAFRQPQSISILSKQMVSNNFIYRGGGDMGISCDGLRCLWRMAWMYGSSFFLITRIRVARKTFL